MPLSGNTTRAQKSTSLRNRTWSHEVPVRPGQHTLFGKLRVQSCHGGEHRRRQDRLWQTDSFTYLKVTHRLGPGSHPSGRLLDDFSRYIIAWKLCTTIKPMTSPPHSKWRPCLQRSTEPIAEFPPRFQCQFLAIFSAVDRAAETDLRTVLRALTSGPSNTRKYIFQLDAARWPTGRLDSCPNLPPETATQLRRSLAKEGLGKLEGGIERAASDRLSGTSDVLCDELSARSFSGIDFLKIDAEGNDFYVLLGQK